MNEQQQFREWRLVRQGEWVEPWCREGETVLMHFEHYCFERGYSGHGFWTEHLWLERHPNGEFVIGLGTRGGSYDIARSTSRADLENMLSDDESIKKAFGRL